MSAVHRAAVGYAPMLHRLDVGLLRVGTAIVALRTTSPRCAIDPHIRHCMQRASEELSPLLVEQLLAAWNPMPNGRRAQVDRRGDLADRRLDWRESVRW